MINICPHFASLVRPYCRTLACARVQQVISSLQILFNSKETRGYDPFIPFPEKE